MDAGYCVQCAHQVPVGRGWTFVLAARGQDRHVRCVRAMMRDYPVECTSYAPLALAQAGSIFDVKMIEVLLDGVGWFVRTMGAGSGGTALDCFRGMDGLKLDGVLARIERQFRTLSPAPTFRKHRWFWEPFMECHLPEIYPRWDSQDRAAHFIQRAWRRCYWDPSYRVCRRRLLADYRDLCRMSGIPAIGLAPESSTNERQMSGLDGRSRLRAILEETRSALREYRSCLRAPGVRADPSMRSMVYEVVAGWMELLKMTEETGS